MSKLYSTLQVQTVARNLFYIECSAGNRSRDAEAPKIAHIPLVSGKRSPLTKAMAIMTVDLCMYTLMLNMETSLHQGLITASCLTR